MNRTQFIAQSQRLLSHEERIQIELSVKTAYLLLSWLQTSARLNIDTEAMLFITATGRQIESLIIQVVPNAAEVLDAGWSLDFDEVTEQ